MPNSYLAERREKSGERFAELQSALTALSELPLRNLCIYATGSYGRRESAPGSDIDLFFVDTSPPSRPLSKINLTLAMAEVIRQCRRLRFPEFDGDGKYFLVSHPLHEMINQLGSQRDDADNLFTARLLLLLESRPLHNQSIYEKVIGQVVAAYFRDFPGHSEDFVPAFLVNDIVRFWKTLCVNYEHKRTRKFGELQRNEQLRLKFRLDSLKLGFTRVMTCYSALAPLAWCDRVNGTTTLRNVRRLAARAPVERLERLARHDDTLAAPVEAITQQYAWFLDTLGGSKVRATEWLSDRNNRDEADKRQRAFRGCFLELLEKAGKGGEVLPLITI